MSSKTKNSLKTQQGLLTTHSDQIALQVKKIGTFPEMRRIALIFVHWISPARPSSRARNSLIAPRKDRPVCGQETVTEGEGRGGEGSEGAEICKGGGRHLLPLKAILNRSTTPPSIVAADVVRRFFTRRFLWNASSRTCMLHPPCSGIETIIFQKGKLNGNTSFAFNYSYSRSKGGARGFWHLNLGPSSFTLH